VSFIDVTDNSVQRLFFSFRMNVRVYVWFTGLEKYVFVISDLLIEGLRICL